MSDVLSWIRSPGPFLIGHRGYPHLARENTPPAFEAALEAACDGIEMDVRVTRDGVLVVHHDPILDGAGGPLHLDAMDWARIQGERFRAGDDLYTVNSLEEVLGMFAGRCLLNVEVKPPGRGNHDETADLLLGALEAVRPRESVLVSSFDPEMLAAVRRRDASVLLGFLFTSLDLLNHLEEEEIGDALDAVHPHHSLVNEKLMKRAEERGWMVTAWTVDEPEEATRLGRLGVTAVITNRPEEVGGALIGA